MKNLQQQFNAVVLGAGGVGKSALTIRFGKNQFVDSYNPTIEEEYRCELIVDDERCILEILDTPGTEQFEAPNEAYIRSGRGFLLVFSLTQEASLRELDSIRRTIYQIKARDKDIPIVVVGTKMDLTHEREVSRAQIQELAVRWGLPFYETSAKRNWHVSEVFEDLVRQMRRSYANEPPPQKRKRKRDPCVIM
ncbi:small GTPase superfamily [Amylocystis lapponica]|nr:small GTPase superfamily [Amylocystis lapponica]